MAIRSRVRVLSLGGQDLVFGLEIKDHGLGCEVCGLGFRV